MTASLSLRGITHDYGTGPVIEDVGLSVAAGQVHGLLGMNGAGKSTLVHIAAGFFPPTRGSIEIDGAAQRFNSPADAMAHGVVLLAQEVDRALVGDLSVHENLTAGLLRHEKQHVFSPRKNRARAQQMLQHYNIDLDVNRRVDSLSLYEKQLLSLVRAAATQARFLILDEPTAAFDQAETQRFYEIVRTLQRDGLGIIFISHRLEEIFELTDHLTVLRHGEITLACATKDTWMDEVVEAITGTQLAVGSRSAQQPEQTSAPVHASGTEAPEEPTSSSEPAPVTTDRTSINPLFTTTRIDLGRGRAPFDLTINAGEIVVAFGPLGSGKTRLARTLFGLESPYRGQLAGSPITIDSPVAATKAGIAFVPEERRSQALWLDENVQTHFALGFRGLIKRRPEKEQTAHVIAEYDVQPPEPGRLVRRLSGGNQQKVAIGKWAGFPNRKLFIFDEPMKGVDVASKEAIFEAIERLADAGLGVLYLTQEPDDAIRIADRVIVLGRSGVQLERPATGLTAADLMLTEAITEGNVPS